MKSLNYTLYPRVSQHEDDMAKRKRFIRVVGLFAVLALAALVAG